MVKKQKLWGRPKIWPWPLINQGLSAPQEFFEAWKDPIFRKEILNLLVRRKWGKPAYDINDVKVHFEI